MIKQATVVVSMLKEVVQLESLSGLCIVKNVKKSVMKEARKQAVKKGKRGKTVMSIDHIRLLIGSLFKKPVCKVKPADRRFLLQ